MADFAKYHKGTLSLIPETTALLVIDPQRGYADPACPGASVAYALGWDVSKVASSLDHLALFIEEVRHHIDCIVFTQMDESIFNRPKNLPRNPKMNTSLCVPGTESYEFFKVFPKPGDTVIQKRTMSAFVTSDLDTLLRQKNIDTLLLTGAYASRCVNDTARSAANLGYKTIICEDLIANPPHLEQYTERDLNEIRLGIGFTVLSKNVLAYFQNEITGIPFIPFKP